MENEMIKKLQPIITTTGIRKILDNEGREIATVSSLLDGKDNNFRTKEADYIHNAICDSFNQSSETIRKLREALKEANRTLVLINPLRSIDTQALIEKVLAETESK